MQNRMWSCRSSVMIVCLGMVLHGVAASASAQQARTGGETVPPAVSGRRETAEMLLAKTIRLDLVDAPLIEAIRAIALSIGNRIVYDDATLPSAVRVTFPKQEMTIDAALRHALRGTNVRVSVSPGGQSIFLARSSASAPDQGVLTGRITGRVINAVTREPVAGAQVVIVETRLNVTAGLDGRFNVVTIPGEYTLRVLRVGYTPFERKNLVVREKDVIPVDVRLQPVTTRLSDVVTTVTGVRPREQLGTNITTIGVDSLVALTPLKNLTDVLDGRAPGVTVMRQGGLVGAPARIRIRGLGSLSLDNGPIVVVDGVRVNALRSDPLSKANQYASQDGTMSPSRLDDINPEMIETIEVLNGPSASTLYGTDAANGVIVITTKRGKAGRPRWRLHGLNTRSTLPKDYPEMYYAFGENALLGPGFSQPCTLADFRSRVCTKVDSVRSYNPLNDDRVRPFGTGQTRTFGAEVSGGSDRLLYFFGADAQDAVGILRASDAEVQRIRAARGSRSVPEWQQRPNTLQKANLSSRFDATLSDWSDISLSTGFIRQTSRATGGLQPTPTGMGYRDTAGYYPSDPWATRNVSVVSRAVGSLRANWKPLDWVSTRVVTGADITSKVDDEVLRYKDCILCTNSRDTLGRASAGRYNDHVLTFDMGGTLSIPLGRLVRAQTSTGVQYTRTTTDQIWTTGQRLLLGQDFPTDSFRSTGSRGVSATFGTYVEQLIAFRERMFLTGAVRRDAGSAFGSDIQAPLYPKIGFSWVLSSEPFFVNPGHVISNLRLRTAYGESGNQPRRVDAYPTYTSVPTTVDGSITSSARLSNTGNPFLKPERAGEWEGGVSLGAFADRVTFDGTWYRKRNRDVLAPYTLPASLGGLERMENLGTVDNRGLELSLDATVIDTRPFGWDVTVQRSANRNKLVAVNAGSLLVSQRLTGSINLNQYRVGYPLAGMWARPVLDYGDVNGDGMIAYNEIVIGDTAIFLGATQPKYTASFRNTVWLLAKRLRVTGQFNYTGELTQFNASQRSLCGSNRCRGAVDPSAPFAEQVRNIAGNPGIPLAVATDYSYGQTTSTLRFAELSVAYNLPMSVTRVLRSRGGSVVVMARNLGLWTKYRGFDPEVNNQPPSGEGVMDMGSVPQTRDWTVRFNLEF